MSRNGAIARDEYPLRFNLELVPLQPHHLPQLYQMVTHPRVAVHWRFRGSYATPEQFEHTLWQNVLTQCVLERDGQLVGWVVAYQADLGFGHVHIAACSAAAYLGSGAVIEGIGRFIDTLCKTWPLRKIYMEVSQRSYSQFASGEGRYFEIEGRLRNHDYADGAYWDKLILAIHEPHIENIRKTLDEDQSRVSRLSSPSGGRQ